GNKAPRVAPAGAHPAHQLLGSRPRALLFEEADEEQEDHGADDGVDDGGNDPTDQYEPDQRQEPTGNDGADDADHDIANQSEAITLDEQAGQPAGNGSDDQPNNQRHDHDDPPHGDVQSSIRTERMLPQNRDGRAARQPDFFSPAARRAAVSA